MDQTACDIYIENERLDSWWKLHTEVQWTRQLVEDKYRNTKDQTVGDSYNLNIMILYYTIL